MNGKIGIAVLLTKPINSHWLYTWLLQFLLVLKQAGHLSSFEFHISALSKMQPELVKVFSETNMAYDIVPLAGNSIANRKLHNLELMVNSDLAMVLANTEMDVHLDSVFKSYRTKILAVPLTGTPLEGNALVSLLKEVSS